MQSPISACHLDPEMNDLCKLMHPFPSSNPRINQLTMLAQIWHLSIVLAVYLHYCAIFAAHNIRYQYSCTLPSAGKPVVSILEDILSVPRA